MAARGNSSAARTGRSALLDRLCVVALRRPALVVVTTFLLLGLAVAAFLRLDMQTDLNVILGTPAARTFERAASLFELGEQAYILVEGGEGTDPDELIGAGRVLTDELAAAEAIESATFELPLDEDEMFARLALPFWTFYASTAELDAVRSEDGLRARIEKQIQRLSLPGLGLQDEWIERDPLELHAPVTRRLATLRGRFRITPGRNEMLSADGRALLVTASTRGKSTSASGSRAAMSAIEDAIEAAQSPRDDTPPGTHLAFGVTGAHALAVESERVVRRDLITSLSASFAVIAVLLAASLRIRLSRVLLLILPTVWGTTIGVGAFAAFAPGLAALSLGCSAILIGLGVDFTIHLVVAARERQASGSGARAAVRHAAGEVRGRLVLATVTSTIAFLTFQLSGQDFLRDMGRLTVLGLFGCLLGAYWVLPPLLARLLPRGARARELPTLGAPAVALASGQRSRVVLLAVGAISALALAQVLLSPPALEDDLRDIHARNSAPLEVQERISAAFGGSFEPLLLLIEDSDELAVLDAAHRLESTFDELETSGVLASRASPATLLPSSEQTALRQRSLVDVDEGKAADRLRRELDSAGFDTDQLADYIAAFGRSLGPQDALTPDRLRAAGFESMVDSFLRAGPERAYGLIVLYPTEELWTPEARAPFVHTIDEALQAHDVVGALTGMHLISAESAELIQSDFRNLLLMTAGLVVVLITVRFRRAAAVVVVLAPTLLGALWTAGLFAAFGMELNFMNLGVLPMVLAIGIDDGIHVVSHWFATPATAPTRERLRTVFRTTGAAVVLTSLTTMVTFGSLGLSANRGLASVGILSFIGVGACLIASVVALPALLHALRHRGPA